ncbi:MAG: hypothetical protein U0167_18795 [bacterium]
MIPSRVRRAGLLLLAAGLVTGAAPSAAPLAGHPVVAPGAPPLTRLPVAAVRDMDANGRLLQHGIPISPEAFSSDGFHFAYLNYVRGGFLRRKPQRCAFLLDMGAGENRALPTPDGAATRIAGWDPSGRYLLVESTKPDILSAVTGTWTTFHWIFDAVTSKFVARNPFTGMRDGKRFRWKVKDVYHGAWDGQRDAKVWALYDGELAAAYQTREREIEEEDGRRATLAARLAAGTGGKPERILAESLTRLDGRWTQRGQRDPVISDLFGDRPALFCRFGEEWHEVQRETEHVAVLDRDLALLTGHGGAQVVLNVARGEILPLPPAPEGFAAVLDKRWDRGGQFYDENDPLPRDLQYRRAWDPTQGTAYYFNYVTPDGAHLLLIYPFGPEHRVLRVVDLPESWHEPAHSGPDQAAADSLSSPASTTSPKASAG